jgi:thymidylate kinase
MSSPLTANFHNTGGSRGGEHPSGLGVESPARRLLQSIGELLDTNGVPYCILRGYEEYQTQVVSDVDFIMPADFLPRQLATLLRTNRDRLGAAVAQWIQHESTSHSPVLVTDGVGARWNFLAVDVSSDYRRNGRVFYGGEEVLASRRRDGQFWVPSPALEFGHCLVKHVAKWSFKEEQGSRLTELYHQDPTGCDREIARFWRRGSICLIRSPALSGEWDGVRELLPSLRRELLPPVTLRDLPSSVRYWAGDGLRRFRRWRAPTGAHVVLLGADGSGKSATLSALRNGLAPAFRRATSKHLAPALFHAARAKHPMTAPHSCPPRSLIGLLARAAYWVADYTLGYYVKVRPALARSTLVLFDRYLLDALVDPRRYRYGGPRWVLHLVWSLIPKPDLVILLDAPTEVLRARKQEVSLRETERQRHVYRELVKMLPNGHVVDAAQPLDGVVTAVGTVVLGFLTSRTVCRLGDHEPVRTTGQTPTAAQFELDVEDKEHRAARGRQRNSA